MPVSRTLSEIFIVEYWYDLEFWVRGHPTSLKVAQSLDHVRLPISLSL